MVQTPKVKERMAALGAKAMVMTSAEFRKFMRDELDEKAKVVNSAGIEVQ